jgi:hypothetical protein
LAPDIALFLGLEADAVIHGAGDGLSKIGLLLYDGCWLLAALAPERSGAPIVMASVVDTCPLTLVT